MSGNMDFVKRMSLGALSYPSRSLDYLWCLEGIGGQWMRSGGDSGFLSHCSVFEDGNRVFCSEYPKGKNGLSSVA